MFGNSHIYMFWGLYISVYIVEARKLKHGFRRITARIPYILYNLTRIMMFQLSGYYVLYIYIYYTLAPKPKTQKPKFQVAT